MSEQRDPLSPEARAARRARKRLTRYIEADEFLTLAAAQNAAQKMGYVSLDNMMHEAPEAFVEFVDALCVELEEDPDYSGNPETGRAWE